MATVVDLSDLALSEKAWRFDGKEHGSTVSFFVTTHEYGSGPDLHVHPYEETFIVEEGAARFTVDGQAVDAHAGQIVVVPPNVPHGFKGASRPGPVRMVSIHPVAEMDTTFLGEPALPPG